MCIGICIFADCHRGIKSCHCSCRHHIDASTLPAHTTHKASGNIATAICNSPSWLMTRSNNMAAEQPHQAGADSAVIGRETGAHSRHGCVV